MAWLSHFYVIKTVNIYDMFTSSQYKRQNKRNKKAQLTQREARDSLGI